MASLRGNRHLRMFLSEIRLSVILLLVLFFIPSLSKAVEPHAFPVPFLAREHQDIYFNDLPGEGTIKIFTVSGEEVAKITIDAGESLKRWDVKSSNGRKVASGVYLYLIDAGGSTTNGKLIVIR